VYVTNQGDNSVSVIDTRMQSVIATVAVGQAPFGVAVSPDGRRVYVANFTSNSVSVIDGSTLRVTATIAVGAGPIGVAVTPDGRLAFVTNNFAFPFSSYSIIDTSTNQVTATRGLSGCSRWSSCGQTGPEGIAASPDGTRLYIAQSLTGDLTAVAATPNGGVVAPMTGNDSWFPHEVAVSPDGSRIVAVYPNFNMVLAWSPTGELLGPRINLNANQHPTGVTFNTDGRHFYFVDNTGLLYIADTATNIVVATVSTGTRGSTAFGQFLSHRVAPPPDTTPPTLVVPPDVTVATDSHTCAATNVNIGVARATDDDGLSPTLTSNAPLSFPLGTTRVTWSATDAAGNTATGTQLVTVNDNEPPTITAPQDVSVVATSAAGAIISNALLGAARVSDNCTAIGVTVRGIPAGNQFPLGTTNLTWTANDSSDNSTSATQAVTVRDVTPPVTTATLAPPLPDGAHGWYLTPPTATLTATDDSSGVASTRYSLDGNSWTAYTGTIAFNVDGVFTLMFDSTDNSGNHEATKSMTLEIDRGNPSITAARAPAANASGWNKTDVIVTFTCADAVSGIFRCPTPIALHEGANQSATGTAVDNAGRTAGATVGSINVDETAPVITYTGNAGTYSVNQLVNIHCTASDALAGIAASTCADISGAAYSFPLGMNTLTASANDVAGNSVTAATTFTVTVDSMSLCTLTKQFVQTSAKYKTLPSAWKAEADRLATESCARLATITPLLTSSQKARAINAYTAGVDRLVTSGWLTKDQAAILKGLAVAL
jgi:YVTN family beta-propeller protein